MLRYVLVSVGSGLLFGVMDALINANPLGRRFSAVYRPIARDTVPMVAGIVIDLLYGFLLAGLFLVLAAGLPGEAGIVKGLSFGALVWILRVCMSVISHWMMFNVPLGTSLYELITGAVEAAVLGILYGLILGPVL